MKGNIQKLVSIIIVNHNSFEILYQCIESILIYNKDQNIEIIIIDNSSIEGDIDNIAKKYQEIKLIKNKTNIGFAAANNQGIAIAKGEYILFLNNDTIFIENSITKILNFLDNFNQKVIVGCILLNEDGSRQISIVDFDNIFNLFGENFFLYKLFKNSKIFNRNHYNYKNITEPIEVDYVKGAFLFCSKKLILELNGFDERFFFYGEEVDLCYRARQNKGKVIFFPHTSIIHIGGATTSKNLWFKFKNQSIAKIQFFQKHFRGSKFVLALSLHFIGIILRVPLYFISGIFTFDLNFIYKSYYYFKQLFIYPANKFKSSF